MKSVIFTFVNKENNECISIGSMWYFQKTKKSCKQIVNALSRNHTEAERQAMMDCTQEELYHALVNTINNNQLHVLYPN